MILQSEPGLNARELAGRCEISRRTVYRDLELISDAGIPVRYDPREFGYYLGKNFFIQPPALTELESLALNVLVRDRSTSDALGLLRQAMEGAIKVVQGLSLDVRERIGLLTRTMADGGIHEHPNPRTRAVNDAIIMSLMRRNQVRLWYRSPRDFAEDCTKFAIYRLLIHDHHWFIVGRSSLHRRIEILGYPWIVRAETTEDHYTIPPRFDLERFLALAWGVEKGSVRHRVRLRFSRCVAPVVEETHRRRALARKPLPGGGVEMEFVVDGLNEILRWVQGFGNEVEVVAPSELRVQVHREAVAVAKRHEPHPS